MRRLLQSVLLAIYRQALGTGVLSTRAGRAVFEKAYWAYKELIEAGEVGLLRQYVVAGQSVIDVGANIGFFTLKFARWVSEGGRVIAFEPEQANFSSLVRRLACSGYGDLVSPIRAAAAEKSGELKLAINPHNPADHWLSESGITIAATTIDDVMGERGWPPVCLIKIDVQGAEGRVLAGAFKTISKYHPALFVEVDEVGLTRAGNNATALIEGLEKSGYRPHVLQNGAVSAPLARDEALAKVRAKGYSDVLFL